MQHESVTIWNATAVSGTQYAPSTRGLLLEDADGIGFVIVHPAATTTDFTLEVSDMSDDDLNKGLDDWHTYAPTGFVAVPQQTGANKFGHQARPPYARCRLKMVNGAGTGLVTVRVCVRKRAGS